MKRTMMKWECCLNSKRAKKRNFLLLVGMTGLLLAGCSTASGQKTETTDAAETKQEDSAKTKEMEEDTSMAGVEESEKNANHTAILAVSFGTSYNDSRDLTIGAIETAIGEAFPEYEVRRAFTSQIIIDKLKERDNLEIDNVEEALNRAAEDGIETLIVQPTHLMDGYEYMDLAAELEEAQEQFKQIVLAEPLLTEDADFDAVIDAIVESTEEYDDGETAICFMGHGTEADSNHVYSRLQEKMRERGHENYYIGTVEAEPTLEDLKAALKEKGTYKKVVLQPLMVVAGDHANNDMAGDEEDSWKSQLENEGYEVICILEGLGQNPAIRDIYVAHTRAALEAVSGNNVAEQ